MNKTLSRALLKIQKRAESVDPSQLAETFVNVGPLFDLLSNPDHQILYGRRGTGKTHAFIYLHEELSRKGDVAIYTDLRSIGSTGGIYTDGTAPLAERATRLLKDTLSEIHDRILEYALEDDDRVNFAQIAPKLDELAEASTDVRVEAEEFSQEITQESESRASESSSIEGGIGSEGPNLSAGSSQDKEASESITRQTSERGKRVHRVHFGRVSNALREITQLIPDCHLWLLLDEWSSIPIELQPYLADLLKRSVFPVRGVSVKIGAIEHRSKFVIDSNDPSYVGIELGADASANLDLDDFMVFDNSKDKSIEFFKKLVYKHVKSTLPEEDRDIISDPDDLVRQSFTQANTFEEFVRAAEGVPRDAIHILSLAVQSNMSSKMTVDQVRNASRKWYQRDKKKNVEANESARDLLHWITDHVIGERKARAFLLRSDTDHKLIDKLYDSRVLHVLKRNVSSRSDPGVRFNVFKLDYGCYVDLITTSKEPQGMLFKDDNNGWEVEVPQDDYRAIRRAVLDLEEFENRKIGG